MTRIALVALLSLAFLSACDRGEPQPDANATADAAPAPEQADAAQARPEGISDAVVEVINEAPAVAGTDLHPQFDAKAFAGTFSAGGTSLRIGADGKFELKAGDAAPITGTWSLEADGQHILLDPDSKSEADRRYKIAGQDGLHEAGNADARLARDPA